ncbi:DUF4255 domain-containing protein [Streptomyces cinnabarinus]|uniref:DUF4255 domain-containing protein n=1 Tax=Streptomyces cinnabarinus TaxID=67287 RepID=A0ABY7K663_9ACTN|nr:DUF4255 domain-containing protein [Streptomyces cinnabarinus]WAZ20009.1 DUF4255 domain-containing protein [Streptomyces cinnabarinus]
MSDTFAVAAVTDTLRSILQGALGRQVPGTVVMARPPDEVAAERPTAALNVYLYRTTIDGAWRSLDPDGTRPGETGRPALPLVLHYVLTPYVSGDAQDSTAHRILGAAMAALHDHAQLTAEEIRRAAPFSDLHQQPEAVRITPVAFSTDDISKLWTAFQSQYRASVAYEARIVLLDSSVPGRAPLPVLGRGDQDRGPEASASTAGLLPTLDTVTVDLTGADPELVLGGTLLDSGVPTVRLAHPVLAGPDDLTAGQAGATEVRAALPADLAAGTWTAAVVLTSADGAQRATREVPFAIVPRITGTLPIEVTRDASGAALLEVECTPRVRPGQRVQLIVGDRPLAAADEFANVTSTLRFRWAGARPGRHALRLRVDGVESPLTDGAAEQPQFATDLAVVVS